MGRIELAAVQLGVDEVRREVLARVVEVVADLREQVVEQLPHARDALLRRQVDAFERVLDELTEPRAVLRREPEHVGDDPHGDVLGVVAGGVDDIPALERVDEAVAQRSGRGLSLGDRGLGERGQQQLARVVVKRRIGGDRRRAAHRRQLAGRPEVAHDDRPRGEALGVVGDRRDVLVAGREPATAEAVGVRDGAALPQVVLDGVRVGRPFGFEVGEAGRPVGDRTGDDLIARAERRVRACLPEVLGEAVVDGHLTPPR